MKEKTVIKISTRPKHNTKHIKTKTQKFSITGKIQEKCAHNMAQHSENWKVESYVKNWVVEQRERGCCISTKMIQHEAKKVAAEKDIVGFTGTAKWCYRFMKRNGLAMRRR